MGRLKKKKKILTEEKKLSLLRTKRENVMVREEK